MEKIIPKSDESAKLSFKTKFFYGFGALSGEIDGTLSAFFRLFFLTNIAGLNPSLAGSFLLINKIWDGINDPLIGWLSDRTASKGEFRLFGVSWGKRYPWMILGAVPFGLFFFLQWVIPPSTNQWLLFAYYTVILLLRDTFFTAVLLPHSALAAELTQDYNEQTSLTSFRSAFVIGGSLFSLVLAQLIFSQINNEHQKYFILGIAGGLLMILAIYLSVFGTFTQYREIVKERVDTPLPSSINLWRQIQQIILTNRPFLIVIAIVLFTGLASNLTAGILPYFITYCLKLPEQYMTLIPLIVQATGFMMLLVWNRVGQRMGKKAILFLGIPSWIIAEIGLFFLQPGQMGLMYLYAAMAGVGLSTAILAPWAMLPDIIDLDELQTQQRREGIFYGLVVPVNKFGIAIGLFLIGRILDFSGFLPHTSGEKIPIQPESALWAIRFIISPLPAIGLIISLVLTYFYPITRDVHQEILLKLQSRNQKEATE